MLAFNVITYHKQQSAGSRWRVASDPPPWDRDPMPRREFTKPLIIHKPAPIYIKTLIQVDLLLLARFYAHASLVVLGAFADKQRVSELE